MSVTSPREIKSIAICGKGGVGKTTISALIATYLADQAIKTLVVDADHAGGLAMALKLSPRLTLNDVRRKTVEERREQASSREDLSRAIDYRLFEALTESRGLALLPLGRPEEKGCFCAVNTLLKEAVGFLSADFEMTLIDAEAGVEQVNREVLRTVDQLLLVTDISVKGVKIAETIGHVTTALGYTPQIGLLVNRVCSEEEAAAVRRRTKLEVYGWIPEDPIVRSFDAQDRSFFELPQCAAKQALVTILHGFGVLPL